MAENSKTYRGVMVSSTFTDLHVHRKALLDAIAKFELMPIGMENDGARADVDVIGSSLGFVRDAAAYIGVIGHKYGQTPACPDRNPDNLSITELEFNEATRCRRPILLFLMADDHPVTKADIERDPVKQEKLERFIERAKAMREGSPVHRVYETFNSAEDFSARAGIAVGRLADLLKQEANPEPPDSVAAEPAQEKPAPPKPPELRAVPRYMGSHAFVGRTSELETLDEWAGEADPSPMLLFEAIGGSGKSMLTWEWVTSHATAARQDWAGRFWYSFYERGALMTDCCREALAYMTGRPVDTFEKLRIGELSERLIQELERRPWLLVLDGLERVLVAYHRSDAAQLRDEEADTAEDQIAKRDPCAAIRPEDDDFLRRLAAISRSKVLVTSRLTPRALINSAGSTVPGVRQEKLQGLRPADAESLMRHAGIEGDPKAMQAYIQRNCGCHPLVVGALAGLINHYMPARGDFDRWLEAPDGGRALNLANLDLIQKRNHILDAAIKALSPEATKLLQTLALLQRGADYELLTALNPHLPAESEEVVEPEEPEKHFLWGRWNEQQRAEAKAAYPELCKAYDSYLEALSAWRAHPDVLAAPRRLDETIRDLERRGLLQYERAERRYDLHPVVRGVAAGRMGGDEREARGGQVVNYFTSQSPGTWDDADSLDDLAPGLQLVATLTQLGRFEDAVRTYRRGLNLALLVNCHAHVETLALLRPFFPQGWDGETVALEESNRSFLLNDAAAALADIDPAQALCLSERKLRLNIASGKAIRVHGALGNLAISFQCSSKLALHARTLSLALDLAKAAGGDEETFIALLALFSFASAIGDYQRADRLWAELDPMGRNWNRSSYRPGDAETLRAFDRWRRGNLTEKRLAEAEGLARDGRNRECVCELAYLRGQYHLERGEAGPAVDSLAKAVRMAREVGSEDALVEARLALARLRAGETFDARAEAQRLDGKDGGAALPLAELWRALNERDRAVAAALRAHEWAIGDGEPYVYRHLLDRTRALLTELGEALPDVPQYDPASDPPFDWEADVKQMIEDQKAERAKRKKKA